MSKAKYKRILLKLSGEALGPKAGGVNPAALKKIATMIQEARALGVQVGLVIGAGNLVRGADLAAQGFNQETGDYMGMLGTAINALALGSTFVEMDIPVVLMSLISMPTLIEEYNVEKAQTVLEAGTVMIFAGGTGKPFCTTDTAGSQRAIEIQADLLLKATKVDGVYSADPCKDPNATFFSELTYDEVLEKELCVMDVGSIELCRDAEMPLRVFNMNKPQALQRILLGEDEGTLVRSK